MSELPLSALNMKPLDELHQNICLDLQNNNNFFTPSSTCSPLPDSTYSLSSLDVELLEGISEKKTTTNANDSGIQSPDVYLDATEECWHAECDNRGRVSIIQNDDFDNVFRDVVVDEEEGGGGLAEAQLLVPQNEDGGDEDEDSFLSADVVMWKPCKLEQAQMFEQDFVGHMIDLHQETIINEEGQMCSSIMSPSVGPAAKVNQETFQYSEDHPNEEGNVLRSATEPSESFVGELQQEASHGISRSRQRTTKETDVVLESDLLYKVHQETVELHKKQEQVEYSNVSPAVDSVSQEVLRMSLHKEETQILISAKSKIHHEAVQTNIDSAPETFQNNFQNASPSTTIHTMKDSTCFSNINIPKNTTDFPAQPHTRSSTERPTTKFTKMKRFSRPNLKDIKPKVISRAASTPRPAITDYSQSATSCKNSNGRAKRREQGDDRGRIRASFARARSITPPTVRHSDCKSLSLHEVKEQTPDFWISKVVINGSTAISKVTGNVREERDNYKEDDVIKENNRDGERNVSSDLQPSAFGTRTTSRGCVSASVRAAPLSGGPKMRVIYSNSSMSDCTHSWKGPPKSKLPIKSGGLSTSLSSSLVGNTSNENKGDAQMMKSEETCGTSSSSSQGKSASTKTAAVIRNRANISAKPNTAGQKATAHVIQTKTTQNALHRGGSGRRNSASVCPSSRGPRGTRLAQTHSEVEEEKKNRSILQLRSLVADGNRRLEALAVVVQHIFNEKEEALKQKKETSIQLKILQEELSQSVLRSEQLECENASVCARLDAAVLSLQQQHRQEVVQLEDRLRDFYSAEWDKAHQVYQEEVDRCTALMRQQVEEIRSKQEALRREQEVTHSRQIEELKQGYQSMITELQNSHERDRQELDNTIKSSEAELNERIASLIKENEALTEKLRDTEEKRKAFSDKNQRDSRVVYLEQELESLKVVLDIKTNQLHQQDKKLMQMDKLMESNVKLEEFVTKLQQENEDYKARIDKHTEMSRQLSTEQAMLQQTLQKESKANKRLSMENEELLWKLHNGLSPRNSASFPSSPISPR